MSSRDSIKCVVADCSNIYNYTGSEGRVGELIELTSEGRRFLIEFRKLIDYVAISGWVRFTEQFTSAPKLHDKIEGAKVQRGAVSQWRSALVEMQNGKCFYDENSRNEFARRRSRTAMVICSGGQDLKSCPRMPKVQQR